MKTATNAAIDCVVTEQEWRPARGMRIRLNAPTICQLICEYAVQRRRRRRHVASEDALGGGVGGLRPAPVTSNDTRADADDEDNQPEHDPGRGWPAGYAHKVPRRILGSAARRYIVRTTLPRARR